MEQNPFRKTIITSLQTVIIEYVSNPLTLLAVRLIRPFRLSSNHYFPLHVELLSPKLFLYHIQLH